LSREFFKESSHKWVASSGRAAGSIGRTNYYVYSTTGNKYKVPEEVYLEINSTRDSFFIYKTGIFGKSLMIKNESESNGLLENIGMLNSARACPIFLIYSTLISLVNLFPFLIVPHKNLNQVLLFIGFCLSVGTAVVYFWWNT
jgi:hypothetical protein